MDEDLPTPVSLPGVGSRIDVTDASGRSVRVVRLKSGAAELHPADGDPIELDHTTAEVVGVFLAGHIHFTEDVAHVVGDAVGDLRFDWVRLQPGDHAVGQSIGGLGVRRRTGVSIVAVVRKPAPIVDPDPDLRLEVGDQLVVVCRPHERDAFAHYLREGA